MLRHALIARHLVDYWRGRRCIHRGARCHWRIICTLFWLWPNLHRSRGPNVWLVLADRTTALLSDVHRSLTATELNRKYTTLWVFAEFGGKLAVRCFDAGQKYWFVQSTKGVGSIAFFCSAILRLINASICYIAELERFFLARFHEKFCRSSGTNPTQHRRKYFCSSEISFRFLAFGCRSNANAHLFGFT